MKSQRRSKPTSTRDPDSPLPRAARCFWHGGIALGVALLSLGLSARPAYAEEGARAQAERLAAELGAKAADRALLSPLLERVRHALERAANARRTADHQHGSELEALALELAQSAVDLQREKQAQSSVTETETKALAAETRVIRARALVEQTAARRGRAAERLRELEAEKQKPASDKKAGASAEKPASDKKAPAAALKPGKASAGTP